MIKLYQFSPVFGLPNLSPFCMKVETYLRMAEVPYQANVGNPMKSPKGKFPYIHDTKHDLILGDSSFIFKHLKAHYGDPLDTHLSETERALGFAVCRMVEEHFYWTLLYSRWVDDPGWAVMESVVREMVPPMTRWFLPASLRRGIRKSLHAQGVGRHSREQIFERGYEDLDAIAGLLSDKPFLLGKQPTSYDATVYSFLAVLLWTPIDSPLQQYAQQTHPQFEDYCQRMKARFYADL